MSSDSGLPESQPRACDRSVPASEPLPASEPAPRAKKWTYKKGVRHFKVMDVLRPEDQTAYLEFVRRPSSTVDSCFAWVVKRGYEIGRGSVYHHRRTLLKEAAEIRRAAEFAHEFVQLARAGGEDGGGAPALAGAFAEATQTAFEQFFMNAMLEMRKQGKALEPRQWGELSRAVGGAVSARRQVEAMRCAFEERARTAAEAVEKAAGAAREPINGVAIANTVRRILGVPLPGERTPGLPPGARQGQGEGGDPAREMEVADEVRAILMADGRDGSKPDSPPRR